MWSQTSDLSFQMTVLYYLMAHSWSGVKSRSMLAESSNDQTDDRKFYGGLGFEIFVWKKRYGVTNRKTKSAYARQKKRKHARYTAGGTKSDKKWAGEKTSKMAKVAAPVRPIMATSSKLSDFLGSVNATRATMMPSITPFVVLLRLWRAESNP